MATPKKPTNQRVNPEVLRILGIGTTPRPRPRVRPMPAIVAEPDAVNETMRVNGKGPEWQARQAQILQQQEQQRQGQERARTAARNNYRRRKAAEQQRRRDAGEPVGLLEMPANMMSDEAVDAAIAQERRDAEFRASQPQIGPANPVWSYPPETRRALGYYTQEEREQAARMNDMRSSTFFGSVMPNFGRQVAYNNPGAEMDAFRNTATYLPNALMMGAGFNLPSATAATINGVRAGWATAGNVGTRAWNATTTAVKSAAPVVANPRYAATTAALTVPTVAEASTTGDYSTALGFGIGVPIALGAGAYFTKGWLWGKAASEGAEAASRAGQYTFRPTYKPFTWEYPTSWGTRRRAAIAREGMSGAIDEWNAAAGNAVKENEFINRYNIRAEQGTPQYVRREVTEPRTYSATKTEMVSQPVMEEVPSTIIGPDGRPLMTSRPKVNADGSPVMEQVEREVVDASGQPVLVSKPVLDDAGQPIMETRTVWDPQLDDAGQQVITYDFIDRTDVPRFLQGRLDGYTSNLPDVSSMILRGPTKSQQAWMRLRNIGRVGTWLGGAAGLGWGGYRMFGGSSSPADTDSADEQDELTNSSENNSPTPTGYTPIKGISTENDSLKVVVKSSNGNDSIIPFEPLTRTRFGRNGGSNQ